jgi:hypothetical protein
MPTAVFQKTFPPRAAEPFSAYGAARKWLLARGYALAAMQGDAPTLVFHGPRVVGKYRTLTEREKALAVGAVEGDFRTGPVTVTLKDAEAIAALEAELAGTVQVVIPSSHPAL